MDISAAVQQEVSAFMASLARLEAGAGVTRDFVVGVKRLLLDLARRDDLFNFADFPLADDGEAEGRLYRLHIEPDGRHALYASTQRGDRRPDKPRKPNLPHQHQTWGVTAAVRGRELNRLYRRLDDRTVPFKSRVEPVGEVMVEPGTGLAMLPDDIHSSHTIDTTPCLLLLLYGRALDEVLVFDMQNDSYELFRPQNIRIAG